MRLDNNSEKEMGAKQLCICCGSDEVDDFGIIKQPPFLATLSQEEQGLLAAYGSSSLLRCRNCGIGFRDKVPSDALLEAIYKNMPTERWDYTEYSNTSWRLAKDYVVSRYSSSQEGIQVLDVGAFTGDFLDSLPQKWMKFAIEPSSNAVEKLKEKEIGFVAELLQPAAEKYQASFDIVTLFDVFEHLRDSLDSLRAAMSYLRPGGELIVSTGDCCHWSWNILKGNHWYLGTEQHIRFASHRFFHFAASELGCELVACTNHSHQKGSWKARLKQAFDTVVIGGRSDSAPMYFQMLAAVILRLPGFARYRHLEHGPYTPAIKDHVFAVLRKR